MEYKSYVLILTIKEKLNPKKTSLSKMKCIIIIIMFMLMMYIIY